MGLVQVSRRMVRVDRVPPGAEPVYELDLMPHQSIVAFSPLTVLGGRKRKTEDHIAMAWIATDLREGEETGHGDQ